MDITTLGAPIKSTYEAEADTNALTDARLALLVAALQPGANISGLTNDSGFTDDTAADAAQATADAALPKAGGQMSGNITMAGAQTVDGRDLSVDGAKLDLIADNADVTNTASVTAAGALMDSEVTNLAAVKAFDPTDYATAAQGAKVDYLTVTQPVDLDAMETRVNQLDAAVVLQGSWDASVGTFPGGGTAQAGDSYIVSVGGTVDSVVFTANDRIVAITDNAATDTYAANWLKLDYTDAVLSVAGLTGAVSAANLRTAINVADGATDDTAADAAQATADAALPKAGGEITGNITCAAGETFDGRDVSADGTQLDANTANIAALVWQLEIPGAVADGDYEFTLDSPYAGECTTLRAVLTSGTCTVTGKVGATPFGGTANSASSTPTEQAHASDNTWAKAATVKITVSGGSSPVDLTVTIYGTRTDL